MLKFDSIIRNLSLDEKISFITSGTKYQSFKVENYDLPRFEVKKAYELRGVNNYLKVSYKSLFSSWGINLATKYFDSIYDSIDSSETIFGVEIKDICKKYVDGLYPNDYLLGYFSKLELDALNNKGYFTCITDFPRIYYDKFDFNDLTPYLVALNGCPSSLILKTKDALDFVNKHSGYTGFKLFEASSDEDAIYALNNGSIFVFYENAKEAILNALDRYDIEKKNLEDGTISVVEFDKLVNDGLIMSNDKLNEVVNDYFSMLLKLDDSFNKGPFNEPVNKNENEIINDLSESIVLLKNNDALPIEGSPRIGIIGDFANKFNCLDKTISYEEVIKKYELYITGYSHGFIEEDIDLDKVYEDALRIACESEYVLLFLGQYNKKRFELPEKEIELIKAIRESKAKIIAIVNIDDVTNYTDLDLCDAIIQTNILNEYGLSAVFDVIFGITTPSGRTTRYCGIKGEKLDITYDKTYIYPLGHGYGYGIFDYTNIEVSRKGVTFTIKNTGAIGSYEIPQLYISSIDSDEINFRLCGFKKLYIEPNESMKFIIPFDEFSFKVFDVEKMKYMIRKGKYQISICNNADTVMLNEIIELDEYIYDDSVVENKIDYQVDIKKAYESITKEEKEKSYIKNDKAYGKGKKLFVSTLIGIYYNALLIFILIANLLGENYLAVTIISIALLVIFDIFLILYMVLTVKKDKKDDYDINQDITDVIDKMEEFDLVSEVTYVKPIPEEKEEEIVETVEEEVTEQVIEEEEEKELTIDKSITEAVDDSLYAKEIDFLAYADDFIYYALNSGLVVEPRTIRSVLGALSSSKMIFLKSQSMDLTLKFADILSKYLNQEFSPIDLSKITDKNELYWKENDGVLSRTNLANDLLQATKNSNKIYLETLFNVDVKEKELYENYLKYSLDPNNSITIKIGEDEVDNVLLNKNIIFLMIPSDDAFLERIDEEIASSSAYIELFIRENAIIQEEPKVGYILSYNLLEQKIKENREKYFIEEDNWKKLDDTEEELSNIEKFSIDNRMTIAFEKMTAIMVESGSDITEVLDYAIASKIIPYIKTMSTYKMAMDESNYKSILINHFGDDTLPVSERALKKPL